MIFTIYFSLTVKLKFKVLLINGVLFENYNPVKLTFLYLLSHIHLTFFFLPQWFTRPINRSSACTYYIETHIISLMSNNYKVYPYSLCPIILHSRFLRKYGSLFITMSYGYVVFPQKKKRYLDMYKNTIIKLLIFLAGAD